MAQPDTAAVTDGARYINRELSWLAFNRRVLEEAQSDDNPLIERAKFLAIVASNLDEFAMVRLAELHQNRGMRKPDAAGLTPRQQLDRVRAKLQRQVAAQYECWGEQIAPALEAEGFRLVKPVDWSDGDRRTLGAQFSANIEPTLTPLAVDPTRPFPLLTGAGIHIGVLLEREHGEPDEDGPLRALVTVPSDQRLVRLLGDQGRFVLAEHVVEAHLGSLFPGHRIVAHGMFRLTRDGSIDVDEEEASDLLEEMAESLRQRAFGPAVRLELQHDAPAALRDWLMEALELEDADVVPINGPLDLTMLFGLPSWLPRADLTAQPFSARDRDWEDPFSVIRASDQMFHHPFDSFDPVVALVERAADDPQVLAIKQTLYRVSGDSPVVRALMRAARAGKQVTVLVELRARFDEEANIRWARRLEQAGAHVIYGLVGYKVHAKLLLVIRRDEDGIRHVRRKRFGKPDQVGAIGAIAVHKDNDRTVGGRKACRSLEIQRVHRMPSRSLATR